MPMPNDLEAAIEKAIAAHASDLAKEIASLVRRTIAAEVAGAASVTKRGPGRPPKAANSDAPVRKKRVMSAAGRASIRAALKKRWAEYRKQKDASGAK
jgi:hypothetical protein